jgi:hypothetical protein
LRGSTHDRSITTTNVTGYAKTIQTWLTASATPNATETDVIVYAQDGSKTETVTDYAAAAQPRPTRSRRSSRGRARTTIPRRSRPTSTATVGQDRREPKTGPHRAG